jgi:hypothetical protein
VRLRGAPAGARGSVLAAFPLAPRFEHRLFLSATPHNGHSNSFSALLEILDPQRFCRGVPVSKSALSEVMITLIGTGERHENANPHCSRSARPG